MGQLELTRPENELLLQLLENVPLSGTPEVLRQTLQVLDAIRAKLVQAELETPTPALPPRRES